MAYDIPKHMIVKGSSVKQPKVEKTIREVALEECLVNYEAAMRLSQSRIKELEKEVKTANKKFDKLVNIVLNNVKKAESILKQL